MKSKVARVVMARAASGLGLRLALGLGLRGAARGSPARGRRGRAGAAGLLLATLAAAAAAEIDPEALKRQVPKLMVQKAGGQSEIGAGFVVGRSSEGKLFVLTALHVIRGAESVEVVLRDRRYEPLAGESFERFDRDLDLAVVMVEAAELALPPECRFVQDARLAEGDRLRALGHPGDSEWQLSADHQVLAVSDDTDRRKLRIRREPIDRGSSGGPLFDERGALAGIVTDVSRNYAVAVKAEAALEVLETWGIPTSCTAQPLPALLRVAASEPRAELRIDDREPVSIGPEGLELGDLEPGQRRLRVTKPGFVDWEEFVELEAGAVKTVFARLEPPGPGRFLVLITSSGEPEDPGVEIAQTTFLGRLAARGFLVVDPLQVERIRANDSQMEAVLGADAVRLAAIGNQHNAEVLVLGTLQSEAQPALGNFHTGRAALAVRSYRASTGQYLWAGTVRVGGGGTPGVMEPSAQQARVAASEQAAEMGAQAIVDEVVPLLDPGALRLAAASEELGEQSQIVIRGPTLQEYEQIRGLLERHPEVAFLEVSQLVVGERLVLTLQSERDLMELGLELSGSAAGSRRLRLAEAESRRLIFDLEEP